MIDITNQSISQQGVDLELHSLVSKSPRNRLSLSLKLWPHVLEDLRIRAMRGVTGLLRVAETVVLSRLAQSESQTKRGV